MQAKVYNKNGEESGSLELPEAVFGLKWNADLVNQVVLSMESSKHKPWAHTKDRGEVSGGGKKPWKQKGTGRARHGSIRSPIWVGGGVAHGPTKDKNYFRKVNKQMKSRSLATVLSAKFKDGELLFVNDLGMAAIKTNVAQNILKNLSKISGYEKIAYKTGSRALILTPTSDEKIVKSFRNIGSSFVDEVRNLNTIEALKYKYLVMAEPEKSLKILSDRISYKK